MENYAAVNVKCPFFKKTGKQEISCEGPYDGCDSVKQIYTNNSERNKQLKIFCECDYEKCEIYRMILSSKY